MDGREEKRRGGGKGEKGKGWRRERAKVTEGMGGAKQDMGWGRMGCGREREERAAAPKLHFLAPPLIIAPAFLNFLGSLLIMRTPFNAELPHYTS